MKIALVTDTHHGVRGDSTIFLNYQKKFFDNIFFPYLQKHEIKTVIHLGDVFDRRKYVNFNTAKRLREDLLNPLVDNDYEVHILAGNHDVYYKSTNSLNAFDEILKPYPFHLYTECQEIIIDGHNLLMVPWINNENRQSTVDKITQTKSQLVFGHLELMGFEMDRGVLCDHGESSDLFQKFDMVFSGHFHQKSHEQNIYYLGAPYQMTWADYGAPRGFHIFDLHTRELQFIDNPYTLFHKIFYNDEIRTEKELMKKLEEVYVSDCYVKIFVDSKKNPYLFDKFLQKLEQKNPQDIRVIEQLVFDEYDEADLVNVQDTQTLLMHTIDKLELDPALINNVKRVMTDIYTEATNIEIDS